MLNITHAPASSLQQGWKGTISFCQSISIPHPGDRNTKAAFHRCPVLLTTSEVNQSQECVGAGDTVAGDFIRGLLRTNSDTRNRKLRSNTALIYRISEAGWSQIIDPDPKY